MRKNLTAEELYQEASRRLDEWVEKKKKTKEAQKENKDYWREAMDERFAQEFFELTAKAYLIACVKEGVTMKAFQIQQA